MPIKIPSILLRSWLLLSFSGFFAGLILGLGISFAQAEESSGNKETKANWQEELFATGRLYDWKTVFGDALPGRDLYNLILQNTVFEPNNRALGILAAKYGLTVEEASDFLDGSFAIILNNNNYRRRLSQGEIFKFHELFKQDYATIREQVLLEQDLATSSSLSELFANGKITDSGFDLLNDLDRIEEILFKNKTSLGVGGKWPNSVKSPNDLLEPPLRNTLTDYLSDAREEENQTGLKPGDQNRGIPPKVDLGEKEIEVEILPEDVCPVKNSLQDALNNLNLQKAEKSLSNSVLERGLPNAMSPQSAINQVGGRFLDDSGYVRSASSPPARRVFCGSATQAQSAGSPVSAMANLSGNPTGFEAEGQARAPGFSVDVAVCVSVEMKMTTVGFRNQESGCVRCEVEKIIYFLKKLLDNSLIPNKVTGNIMESAKCKMAFTPLLDMKVISVAAPMPGSFNNTVLKEKSLVDNWNTFVKNQLGLKLGNFEQSKSQEFALKNTPKGESYDRVLQVMEENEVNAQREAKNDTEAQEIVNIGDDSGLVSSAVLKELRVTENYFNNFATLFEDDISKACNQILQKKDLN